MKALIRLSPDITTKAPKTRKRFLERAAGNLRAALAADGYQAKVVPEHARMYLEYDQPEALRTVQRVFGIHSVSPAHEEPFVDLETLLEQGERLMAERVEGRTFAVRARIADKRVGFRGQQVNEALGERLTRYGRVHLDAPDVTVRIELRNGRVHFYTAKLSAESGLPVGAGGRGLVLLSGGFDSAVAAWLVLRRGVAVDYVGCQLGGERHAQAMVAVANRLSARWARGLRSRLYVVPFEEVAERIRRDVAGKFQQLVLKRAMYRAAQEVARRLRADGLVTGESLGQVSSQTLPNLRALDIDMHVPVHRPLLTHSKTEILELARHVGTHHLSSGVPEYCALNARPATGTTRPNVRAQEERLELDEVALVDEAGKFELPHEGTEAEGELTVEQLPSDAVVLDLRTPPQRRAEEIPGARAIDPLEVLGQPEVLDAEARYVVVCAQGGRSLWFARKLRDLGFRAQSLVSAG